MARSLKLFEFVRRHYGILGIYSAQPNQSRSCNLRKKIVLLCMILVFISTTAFILFEAKSIEEIGASFTAFFMELFVMIFFIINIRKISEIINSIEMMEKFIEKSTFMGSTFLSNSFKFYRILF